MSGSCFVCGSNEFKSSLYFAEILGIPEERIRRCANCGLAMRDVTSDSIACSPEYFDRTGILYNRAARLESEHIRRKLGDIARFAPRASRLLELGCGRGAFLLAASARYEVRGIDVDPGNIQECLAKGLSVVEGKFDEPLRPAGLAQEAPFDVVYTNHVMEHVSDPLRFLLNARQSLMPGGLLSLEIPQEGRSLIVRLKEITGLWKPLNSPRRTQHNWFFTTRSLRLLLAKAGFEIKTITTTDSIRAPSLIRRVYSAANALLGWGSRIYVVAAAKDTVRRDGPEVSGV